MGKRGLVSLGVLMFVLIFLSVGSVSAYNDTNETTAALATLLFSGNLNVAFNQSTAHVGDTVTMTVTVVNDGLADWCPVEIYAPVPARLQYESFVIPDKNIQNYDSSTGIWDLYSMKHTARGQVKTLIMTTKVLPEAAGKTLTATASFKTLVLEGYGIDIVSLGITPSSRSNTLTILNGDNAGNSSGSYTNNPITANASVKGGLYNTTKLVRLSMNQNGTIRYTTDGSMPSTASTVYTSPINITHTTTLRFFAENEDAVSSVYTVKYMIDKIAPKVSVICPTSSSAGVLRTKTVSIRLSENVLKGVNWSKVYIKNLKSGQKCKATIWINGNHLYISTNSKKAANTLYQVYIPAAAIKDSAGNNLAAVYTFKFKTGKS
jgi:conserved repeat domain